MTIQPTHSQGTTMYSIDALFDRVAIHKYPDGTALTPLRMGFKLECYEKLAVAIEQDWLLHHTREQVVEHCAALMLAGPGGTDFTADQAEMAVGAIALGLQTGTLPAAGGQA